MRSGPIYHRVDAHAHRKYPPPKFHSPFSSRELISGNNKVASRWNEPILAILGPLPSFVSARMGKNRGNRPHPCPKVLEERGVSYGRSGELQYSRAVRLIFEGRSQGGDRLIFSRGGRKSRTNDASPARSFPSPGILLDRMHHVKRYVK